MLTKSFILSNKLKRKTHFIHDNGVRPYEIVVSKDANTMDIYSFDQDNIASTTT